MPTREKRGRNQSNRRNSALRNSTKVRHSDAPKARRLASVGKPRSIKKRRKSRATHPGRHIPKRNDHRLSDAALKFLHTAADILEVYSSKRGALASPYERPISEFKRKAYSHIRKALSSPGGHNMIKSIHRDLAIQHKGPMFHENPFYWGLLAFDEKREKLKAQEVGFFSRQMFYADKHDVPPCLLVGFLHQIGSRSKLSLEKLKAMDEQWDRDERIYSHGKDQ